MLENKKQDFRLKVIGVLATVAVSSLGSYYKAKEDSRQSADAGYKTIVGTVDKLQDAVMQLQSEVIRLKAPVPVHEFGAGYMGRSPASTGPQSLPNIAKDPIKRMPLIPPEKLFQKKALPSNLEGAEQYQKSL